MQAEFGNPFNALPPVVWLLAVALVAIEAAFQLGAAGVAGGAQGVGWRIDAVGALGLPAVIPNWMIANGYFPLQHLARFLTFPLVHTGALHVVFVVLFVLTLGKALVPRLGQAGFLALFLISGAVGGLVWALVYPAGGWMVGGYAGSFGLVGAFTLAMWQDAAGNRQAQLRAFGLIGVLLLARAAFGVLGGFGTDWVADVVGFFVGAGLAPLLAGGWRRLFAGLRQ
jgi:rhomboid protease GluP